MSSRVEQFGDVGAGIDPQAGRQHDAEFGDGRRADPGAGCRCRELGEDRSRGRARARRWQRAPTCRRSCAVLPEPRGWHPLRWAVRRRPSSSGGTSGHTSRSRKRRTRPSRSAGSTRCASRCLRSANARRTASVLLSPASRATSSASRSTSAFLMFNATGADYTIPPFLDTSTTRVDATSLAYCRRRGDQQPAAPGCQDEAAHPQARAPPRRFEPPGHRSRCASCSGSPRRSLALSTASPPSMRSASLTPRSVSREAESLVLLAVGSTLWDNGWQPAEVIRLARRADGRAGRLMAAAVAVDHARRDPSTLHPRWAAQVESLDLPDAGSASGWVAEFARARAAPPDRARPDDRHHAHRGVLAPDACTRSSRRPAHRWHPR